MDKYKKRQTTLCRRPDLYEIWWCENNGAAQRYIISILKGFPRSDSDHPLQNTYGKVSGDHPRHAPLSGFPVSDRARDPGDRPDRDDDQSLDWEHPRCRDVQESHSWERLMIDHQGPLGTVEIPVGALLLHQDIPELRTLNAHDAVCGGEAIL